MKKIEQYVIFRGGRAKFLTLSFAVLLMMVCVFLLVSVDTKASDVNLTEDSVQSIQEELDESEILASGVCGANMIWTLDIYGYLYIEGSGDMYEYHPFYENYEGFGYYAAWYEYRSYIKYVIIEEGVTSIRSYSFYGCSNLVSVEIPDGVTTINGLVFESSSITSVEFPDSVTYLGDGAFYNCHSLTYVKLPEGLTSLGNYVFYNCYKLISIKIPDSVTSLGDGTFQNCYALTDLDMSEDVTSFGILTFQGCEGLADEEGYVAVNHALFDYYGEDTVITLPDYITSIKSYAFEECFTLTDVTIPNSVTYIGAYAFDECSELESVSISNSVISIPCGVFQDCESLKSVVIPDSVINIVWYAFYGCTSLTDVYYVGNEDDWAAISIGDYNECLTSAVIWYFDFVWSDDYTTCSVSVTNSGDSDAQTLDCTVTTSVFDSTCTEDGKIVYTAACSFNEVIVSAVSTVDTDSATGHTAGEATQENVVEATCTTDGSYDSVVYCTVCGEEISRETITVSATGHTAGEAVKENVVEATTDADGSYESVIYCAVCGNELSRETVTVPATGDTGTDDTDTGSSDTGDTDTGSTDTGDTDTGDTDTGSTDTGDTDTGDTDTGNTDTGSTDTGNTDTGDTDTGSTDTGSTDTGDTDTGNTDTGDTDTGDSGTAHTHSYTSAVTTAATCTTDGVTTYTCSCGDSYTEAIPATGHTWDEGTVTLAATRVSEGEKTYTCTACGETKTETIAQLTAATFLFSDVTNDESWYYAAVYWAYDLSITEGYSDGTFRPNNNCTRAEFTTFLYQLANAYGLENAGETESTSFTDVAEGSWYYTYVMWAAENGLVSGYSDGTFQPNKQITRAEAVTMLYGFYKSFVNGGQEPTVSDETSGFSDLSEDSWFYTYMLWATQNGVVSGYDDGTCRPNTNCTRSVMVVLLYATANHLL